MVNITSFRDNVSPKTRRNLIVCPKGCNKSSVNYEFPLDSKHFVCICSDCRTKWFICLNCSRQHTHYRNMKQLNRHQLSCNSKNNIETSAKRVNSIVSPKLFSHHQFFKFTNFGRKENIEYYFHNQNNNGPSYIVGLSQYHLPNISNFLKSEEVTAQIRIADLLLGLYPKDVETLLKIFIFFDKQIKQSSPEDKWGCQLPTNFTSIRQYYKDGKHAIHSNLPYPSINQVNGHSYVSIKQIVQDALANHIEIDDIYAPPIENEIRYLNNSLFCKKLAERQRPKNKTIDILITTWSDDFEPNNVKQNKGNSVWVFTVTIYTKHENKNSTDHTYIISLGMKNDNHEPIEKLFYDELAEINNDEMNSYYMKNMTEPINVRLHLVASICDLPERYTRCCITRGNGNHTTRWGYLCNGSILKQYLPPCLICENSLKLHIHNESKTSFSNRCEKCTCWSMDENSLLHATIPTKFHDFMTVDGTKLPVMKIDFNLLRNAITHCYNQLKDGDWSNNDAANYLSMYGINSKLQESIITKGLNEFITNNDESNEASNDASTVSQSLREEKENFPERFGKPTYPPSWSIPNGMKSFIDAPMHLIFLGCVKLINKRMLDWAALFKKETMLVRSFSAMIPSIYDLKLEWCKIFPLSNGTTFSGLVSENWLAVARLCKWMYMRVPFIITDDNFDISHPKTSVFQWKASDVRKWLALRGISRKGLIHELKQIINQYLSNPDTIPPIQNRYTCPVSVIKDTLIHMHCFIQRAMQSSYTNLNINETENYIKLFLTSLNEWDTKSKEKNSKPIWILSYSLLNLLNLPDMMRMFGPIRNLWEGGSMGEGILKLIKHNIPSVNVNWHINSTKKFYQQKSLNRLVDQLSETESRNTTDGLNTKVAFKERASNFHIYGKKQNVINAYHSGQPISIIIDRSNMAYAVVDCDCLLSFSIGNLHSTNMGHVYYEIGPPESKELNYEKFDISSFGLMLPLLKETISEDDELGELGIYTIITSDWKEIMDDKTFGFYKYQQRHD